MSIGDVYRQLAYDTFEPQLITDLDDDDKLIEVCQSLIKEAGYPLGDNEDDWLEYVYAAQEIVTIQQTGWVYRRESDASKPNGWDYVLYTKVNHPAFINYS